MLKAVIFSDLHSLDFSDIRHNVIRIPEVLNKVKEAQEISDKLGEDSGFHEDFYSVLASDNTIYNKNIKLKSVLSTIIQLGLYERYVNKNGQPDFLMGDINGVSPLAICSGDSDLESLLAKDTCENVVGVLSLVGDAMNEQPLLSGVTMSMHHSFKKSEDEGYEKIGDPAKDMGILIQELIEGQGVKQLIDVGPGSSWLSSGDFDHSMYDIQVLESINMDPMLSWFWPYVRNQNQSLDLAN